MKVVEIELASEQSPAPAESKKCASEPQTKSEVLNRMNGSAELYDEIQSDSRCAARSNHDRKVYKAIAQFLAQFITTQIM